jgi:hypothetical protein
LTTSSKGPWRHSTRKSRSIAFTVAALGLAGAGLVNAVDDAFLNVERVVGDGWTA